MIAQVLNQVTAQVYHPCTNVNKSKKGSIKFMLRKKLVKILVIASAITIVSSFSAFADWEQQSDSTWKYKDDISQQYIASQWIESATEKGLWYYLDENGVMAVNTTTPDGYYVNDKGEWRESSGGSASVNQGNQSNVGGQTETNQNSSNFHSIELGDKPIQSDPEFDQEFNEGLIR